MGQHVPMMGQHVPMMGQQSPAMQYPPTWMQVPAVQEEELTPNSAARAAMCHKCREYDNVAASRSSMGYKPNQLDVKSGGYVDQGSARENAWDDAIRSLVPRLLDMSVIEWEGHRPELLEKLREALDLEFEYIGCPLSMCGNTDSNFFALRPQISTKTGSLEFSNK
jgi:hypothetical protein